MSISTRKVRLVVGADPPIYRDGIVAALNRSEQTEVVTAVADGQAALAAIVEHSPDVALLDYKMPGLDGIAVAHAVTRDGLSTRVLLLSATTEGSVVYKAIQDGAAGYLSKDSDRDEIVNAVVACARGEKVLPPDLVTSLATQVHRHAQTHGPLLSERERQTLRMIADGKTVRDMAKELFLAETTIKTHIRRLYEKLGVSDRGAAVAYAMRNNLLE